MASRLSDVPTAKFYEQGGVPAHLPSNQNTDLLLGPPVDLDQVLLEKNPKKAVQAVAPQALYFALTKRGLEDSLDVLQLISRSQLVRLFDYTVWREDRLAPDRAFAWLELYQNLGKNEVYKRFRQLDEEYQLALLGPYVELYDEETVEKMSGEEQDQLTALPCGTLHYKIKTEDKAARLAIEALVEACLGSDISYTYSLLAHAAYMPPSEQEALIAQFRRARLEEDGFVSYEESLRLFRPVDFKEIMREANKDEVKSESLVVPTRHAANSFLMEALQVGLTKWSVESYERVTRGFAALTNGLCAAAGVEADDELAIRRLLDHASALAGLGLEFLSGGDINKGVAILADEAASVLFRTGLGLLRPSQEVMVDALDKLASNATMIVRKLWMLDKRGAMLAAIEQELGDVLGLERTERIKGVLSRFPVFVDNEERNPDGRLVFRPVGNRAAAMNVAAMAYGYFGLMHLAELGQSPEEPDNTFESGDDSLRGRESERESLDTLIASGIARVALGEEFRSNAITPAEMEAFIALSQDVLESRISEFFSAAQLSITIALQEQARKHQDPNGPVPIQAAVQFAMEDVADLVLRLRTAGEQARKLGLSHIDMLSRNN